MDSNTYSDHSPALAAKVQPITVEQQIINLFRTLKSIENRLTPNDDQRKVTDIGSSVIDRLLHYVELCQESAEHIGNQVDKLGVNDSE